jgi:hypothetical protein
MSVTILSPLDGDTVVSPVTVTCGYHANASFTVESKVGANSDGGKKVSSPLPDGVADSNAITVAAPSPPTFAVTAAPDDGSGGGTQNNITVLAAAAPLPVGGTITFPMAGMGMAGGAGGKTIHVDGVVAPGSTAEYVVVQVIEVNLATQKYTPVAAAADTVKDNGVGNPPTWKVEFKFPQQVGFEYVARMFAFDKALTRVASSSKRIA